MVRVAVLGLGGMGSAAAAHLARRGADVVGVEQFTPGHDRGSSHGDSRVIRQAYFEDPSYVPLLLHAYDLWADLERDDPGIFRLTGGLMLGRPDAETVAGSLASARQHGLPHETLDAADIRRRFPMFAPDDDEVGVYEERERVRPPRADGARARTPRGSGRRRPAVRRTGHRLGGRRPRGSGDHHRSSDRGRPAGRLPRAPGRRRCSPTWACRCG